MGDINLKDAGNRQDLIRAAALTFLQDEQLAVNLAGVTTDKFVQSARKAYRTAGFNFSDSDVREVHNELRSLVAQRGLQEKYREAIH